MEAPTILHEETNYVRLNLAIRTTCAICLRDVLLKNVPRGFTDIYDAVLCMRNQLKQQITIQHFSQLFPHNSSSPDFTVTNCDIPLLYSLIRNVSSVSPPITGWGKPVMDQPRDTSVGANVERLRDRRNHIIHLLEPKVSNHDFHKLWEEVTHCIVDIEVVLGGDEHQQKLEHLKTANMDPNFVNREISYVKRVVQEIQEKQNQKQDYILEIRQDQVAHGSILNDIARSQNEHDDILDVLKAGQGDNITALCNIQTLLNNNQVTSEEMKKLCTFQSQSIEQGIESLRMKLDQVLEFQGKEQLKDQKIETHGNHKEKELSAPNKVLYELPNTNGNQTQCLEESTTNQACKGQTMIIPDSTLGQESSEDTSVTDNTQPHETIENSSLPNWTVDEIVMVWPSIETLLLEDLCPKLVISFFEKGNVFSKDECDMIRRKARRRTMTKELLSIMKDRLPQSFAALFHALNETDQQDISKELKCIIKGGPVKEAPVPNSHCFTVKAKVMQHGQTLQTVEYQVNTHINQKVLISLPLTFELVGSEMGSVIIHLRASGRNSYDAMVAFCKHGGMKNFILSLLKEKEVFNSLPAGEISIEIQVRQDEEDLNYEAKQFEAMKKVRMTENECSFSCPAIDVADESHVIKENLLLQYEYVADEIDPLHFAEIFINRGILDESFFKDLKNYRRGKRAVLFLNKVLEKGKEAFYALTEDLKNKGCEDLVDKLCFAHRRSKEQRNIGNLDGDLVKVELEVPDKYFGDDLMWSCRLKCAVEKNIYADQPAYDSLGDLGAAAPRSIIPESNAAHKDNFWTMSTLDSDNPESFNQQAELDQIVSEYKVNRMTDEMNVSHGDDSSEDTDMSESDSDGFLYQRPALTTGNVSSSSSSDLDDTVYKRQTPIGNKRNTSSNNLDNIVSQRQTPAVNRNNFSDTADSWKEEDVEISLRRYQQELARPAIQGKNVIIVAPTGSGKTRVACRIVQEHFQQMRQKRHIGKVILLVRDVALADQHGKTLQELLRNYRTQAISGDTKRNQGISLEDSLHRHDILVLTAQLLLNSLMNGEIQSITQFSLIIFDECHHCHDEHSYNKIMHYYLDIKLRPGRNVHSLPQIIGLTASVGVGKACDVLKAKEHIIKLMANLDAELISTVKENQEELQRYVATPTSDAGILCGPETEAEEPDTIIPVRPRANDAFRVSITRVMNAIENMMRNADVVKKVTRPPNYVSELNAPADKGSEPYIQWISNMWKATTEVHDPEVRRFIRPCYKHLQWYNEALIIYNDARVKDAVDFLKEKMDDWQSRPKLDGNEQCLLTLYRAGTQPKYIQEVPNPKLNELKKLILKSFREKSVEESRCIVFVKTRALAAALVSWMTDTPELNELSPTVFVGANAAKDKGGITRFQQGDKLAEFRRGRYKIMVATSVAEEGLDIQQCNLVLRYDHVTHEIAMVQSRGRARAMDSKYHVLAQIGKGTAAKEEVNIRREKLMQKAINELQGDIQRNPPSIRKNIRDLQEEDKLDRDLLAQQKKQKQKKQKECELRCIQCNEFICMSSDIRKIQNAHNVVIDKTLRERVSFAKSTTTVFQDDEIEFSGKIFCSKCHEDFGQICIYRHQEYPVIKIEKFIIVTDRGEHKSCKKWKQVPFEVPKLTHEDRKKLLDSDDLE